MKKISNNTQSELLLNLKDIEAIKKGNYKTKSEDFRITMEKSLSKYNKRLIEALNAPIPDISIPFNEVVCRAVPVEIKSKGGLILSTGTDDINIAKRLDHMSIAIESSQEILLVGDLVTEKHLQPGYIAKINFKRFRTVEDNELGGLITKIELPTFEIEGHTYLIIDKRDIIYTCKKK